MLTRQNSELSISSEATCPLAHVHGPQRRDPQDWATHILIGDGR